MTDLDPALSSDVFLHRPTTPAGILSSMPGGLIDALHESLGPNAPCWVTVNAGGSSAWFDPSSSPANIEAALQASAGRLDAVLPPRGILQATRLSQSFHVAAPVDLALDVHGLRLPDTGVLAGLAAVRQQAGRALINATLTIPVWKLVERDASGIRLRFFRNGAGPVAFPRRPACQLENPEQSVDPLAAAMAGAHPVERLYELLSLTGSRRWAAWAAEIGVPGRELEDFRSRWIEMGRPAALAVWRAAANHDSVDDLFDWTTRLNHDLYTPGELDSALRNWIEVCPEFRFSPTAEWIEAAAAEPLAGPLSPAAFDRLRQAARHLHALFNDEHRLHLLYLVYRWAALSSPLPDSPSGLPGDLARHVLRAAASASALQWEARSAALLQSPASGDLLLDITLSGPGHEQVFHRIAGGDLSPLLDSGQTGLLPGFGVLTHLLPCRIPVEVHLPFFDRYDYLHRLEQLRHGRVSVTGSGQIVVLRGNPHHQAVERDNAQNVLALTGSWRCTKAGVTAATYTLSAEARTRFDGPASAFAWSRLLASYGFCPSLLSPVAAPGADCSLSLSLPGELAAAWTSVPPERDAAFLPLFRSVSLAVQTALRSWGPALWLHSEESYAQYERAHSLLAWAATRPFEAVTRSCLTYDIFDHGAVERALRSAQRGLPALFASIAGMLESAGRPNLAAFYSPSRCAGVVGAIRRRPRAFRALLVAETFLVNQLTQLAVAGQHVRALSYPHPSRALKLASEFSERHASVVQQKLSRLCGENDLFAPLGAVLLVEATAALTGRPDLRQAVARVSTAHETLVSAKGGQ